jgi:hypothetical protein
VPGAAVEESLEGEMLIMFVCGSVESYFFVGNMPGEHPGLSARPHSPARNCYE